MDRVLVMYDLSGQVWNIVYGATEAPQGIPSVWCDLPQNATIKRVNPVTKEVEFDFLPETDLGQLQAAVAELSDHVAETEHQTASDISSLQVDTEAAGNDITDLQIALAEVYEVLIDML